MDNQKITEIYKTFLCSKRRQTSSLGPRPNPIDEFYSDRSRIIFSTSFRRLLQKAQVFSLEPNASVRTRLTHSLEVADLGRTLASMISQDLVKCGYLKESDTSIFVAIVENACLVHDIGNPPFGHFGENAIRDWAKQKLTSSPKSDGTQNEKWPELDLGDLKKDFELFDGNPQGFRTITNLHNERDEYGLNLTLATLSCCIKYACDPINVDKNRDLFKKPGYFLSESDIISEICKLMNISQNQRSPLTYIMEAADDIAYCLSDISDGIEKGIISLKSFVNEFNNVWDKLYPGVKKPKELNAANEAGSFTFDISIKWSKKAMEEARNNYINNHESILTGTAPKLLSDSGGWGKVFKVIQEVSKHHLYSSFEAESIELSGYAVILGILGKYEKLLSLPCEVFEKILNDKADRSEYAYEIRLFNRLGHRYVKAYKNAKMRFTNNDDFKQHYSYNQIELWLRIHLIIDHIAGMTDDFALEIYQMLNGIKIIR